MRTLLLGGRRAPSRCPLPRSRSTPRRRRPCRSTRRRARCPSRCAAQRPWPCPAAASARRWGRPEAGDLSRPADGLDRAALGRPSVETPVGCTTVTAAAGRGPPPCGWWSGPGEAEHITLGDQLAEQVAATSPRFSGSGDSSASAGTRRRRHAAGRHRHAARRSAPRPARRDADLDPHEIPFESGSRTRATLKRLTPNSSAISIWTCPRGRAAGHRHRLHQLSGFHPHR